MVVDNKGRELAQKLAKDFSYENLENFLFTKGFTILKERLPYFEDEFSKYLTIQELYNFAELSIDHQPVQFFTIKTDEIITERSSKKRQFEIAKRLLRVFYLNIGLFIFYDQNKNFRFSLVFKIPYGTKAEYSYYKRFTFFVSPSLPNKTFIIQIGDCSFKSFEDIKSAFSIEPITKQFYEEIQAWYYYAMDNVWFPEDYKYSNEAEKDREIRSAQNLIRLLTRLIFIWFLKVKGLIPEDLFDKEKLKNIVKDFGNSYNYYNAILQNLFFATLNRPINERGWAKNEGFLKNRSNFGVKTLYRYEDKFLISPDEVLTLFKEIPFINGGLFDCLDKDSIYIDGFSRNFNKQAKIPDYLFFKEKEEIVDLSKYGLGRKPFRGLIEILKSYNFTTDEATPIDQEIALDPELLGKVFENLLASYNPETSTTARKATGSYYTPREIVDYMVEESLKEYFKIRLSNIPEEKIELLLSYSEEVPELSEEEKKTFISAIDELKILDPACGSGAFLMGVLHKLVYILQKIDPDNKYWYELQFQKAIKETEEVFKDIDKLRREELLKEINEAFDESINYPDYARKLYLIENCIYGVDIQPIAIQISKLRFFISLILDQKVDPNKENFGIRPLPHLETKFVSANTLIGLEKPQQLPLKNIEIAKKEEELKKLRHKHFRVKRREEKQKIEDQYKKIKKELVEILKKGGWNDKTAQNIVSFDPFDQNASVDWFDPEWMFGVTDGFDIVIGNPPYGDLLGKDVNKASKEFVEKHYKYSTLSDISSPFVEKGVNLLKEHGTLIYIITFAITFNKDFSNTRKLLRNSFERIEVLTFDRDKCDIFESMSQSVSILKAFNYKAKERKGFYTSRMFRSTPDFRNIELSLADDYLLPIGANFSVPHRLPKLGEKINAEILKKLILNNKDKIEDILKKRNCTIWIRTSGNYWYNAWDREPYKSTKIKTISVDKDYCNFLIVLMNSSLFYFWFRIYGDGRDMNLDVLKEFRIPTKGVILKYSILLKKVREKLMESLFSVFDNQRKRFLTSNIKDQIDLADFVLCKYLYGFYYNEVLHILDYDKEVRGSICLDNSIVKLVDQILSIKKQNPDEDTSHLEKQIDQLVYKLYDLTEEEIKIIEGA